MDTEHRTSTRAAVTYPVRLSSDSMTGEGTVINLSVPGCAIKTTCPFSLGVSRIAGNGGIRRGLDCGAAKVRWTTNEKVGIGYIRGAEMIKAESEA